MSYPGVGTMLDTPARDAGIVDLACPIKAFEPLRLAPRFSTGAELYDLSTDRHESKSVANGNPAVAKRLTGAALAWRESLP